MAVHPILSGEEEDEENNGITKWSQNMVENIVSFGLFLVMDKHCTFTFLEVMVIILLVLSNVNFIL